MTTDKALDAVKKAVEQLLPHVEHRKAMMAAYGHDMAAPFDAAQLNVLLAALLAIAPGGPLAVVPREPTNEMLHAGLLQYKWDDQSMAKSCHKVYHAMIAEGEK